MQGEIDTSQIRKAAAELKATANSEKYRMSNSQQTFLRQARKLEKIARAAEQKEWSSALDEDVRGNDPDDKFDHRDSHVSIVDIDKPFIVSGEELMHPGDQSKASAGNVIQCRCAVLPVVD